MIQQLCSDLNVVVSCVNRYPCSVNKTVLKKTVMIQITAQYESHHCKRVHSTE
jgi:hypothetical protein